MTIRFHPTIVPSPSEREIMMMTQYGIASLPEIIPGISYIAGKNAIRMSIARPTHFWPSLDPWAKLTKALAVMSVDLIHVFGYLFQNIPGCLKKSLFFIYRWSMCIDPKASTNPINGEKRRDSKVSTTLCQGRMTVLSERFITRDTQRIEPISVWELDAGIPMYHVPKFQIIAAMRSESTAHIPKAIPWLEDSYAILSSGRSFMMPIATPVPPITTPKKLKNAARSTAFFGQENSNRSQVLQHLLYREIH